MPTLNNGVLRVQVDETGAELTSLVDLRHDRELLWQGDPAWWAGRSPLLFPIVGRLKDDRFEHGGKTYSLPIHGFARKSTFTLVAQDESRVVYELCDNEWTRAGYPFGFCLQVEHRLAANRVQVGWRVRNTGESRLYFSIGGHPGFFCPLNQSERLEDCTVDFHTDAPIRYGKLDAGTHCVLPEKFLLPTENGRMKLTAHTFDHDAILIDDLPFDRVSLCGADGRPFVTLHASGFPSMGIWSRAGGAPYVCLEPWMGCDDDLTASGVLAEKRGVIGLEAGQLWQAGYAIEVP